MSLLTQLAQGIVELDIKGVKIQAKKFTLSDLANVSFFLESQKIPNETMAGKVKEYLYSLFLCVQKVNTDISFEEIEEIFSPEDIDLLKSLGEKVGFIIPPVQKKRKTTEK